MIFPQLGDWTWQAIADLRRDPNVARFRAILKEIEEEAAADAVGGDIEAAAHHAYERHLARAIPSLDGIGAVARKTTVGLLIGGATGLLTMGITGPGGPVVGAVIGVAPGTIAGLRE